MQVLGAVELRHPIPGSAQSLSTEPGTTGCPTQSQSSRRSEMAPKTPQSFPHGPLFLGGSPFTVALVRFQESSSLGLGLQMD